MAGFHTKTFLKHDDYMTPLSAWDNIKDYIPKDKVIWEAFYGDGKSGEHLKQLGFNVIHEEIDFFDNNKGDIIVSNPPFSKSKEIFIRLKEIDKPFILILPTSKISTSYLRENFKDTEDPLQIIIPRRRIQFIKNGDEAENKCNFDCFYYCYKIGLKKDILWLG
tara:strand:+ start:5403 stop:5894 length:492 start_codon:yes stop_codon:yes gene_type:complete